VVLDGRAGQLRITEQQLQSERHALEDDIREDFGPFVCEGSVNEFSIGASSP
jgi:hypothetical protein